MRKTRTMNVTILGGQTVVIDEAGGYAYFWLRRGAYLAAGKDFGWTPPNPGVGVNNEILDYCIQHGLKIRVIVRDSWDRAYQADPVSWLNFAEKTQSVDLRGGRSICLLPWRREFFKTVKVRKGSSMVEALEKLRGGEA